VVQPAMKDRWSCGRFCLFGRRKSEMGKVEVVSTEGTESGASPSERWRVVVADDHPPALDMLKQVLDQQPDLEVVGEAQDGHEALELCYRLRPEVVLIEAHMPKMNGIEATRRIKVEFPSISVLVMNTLGDPDQLLEALKAGAAGYVLKRSGSQQIRDAVRGALIGEYTLDEELTKRLLRRLAGKAPNGSSS
jgi:DNA-binding NarL/FixJ family response regulator